jgi:hypothetical protein
LAWPTRHQCQMFDFMSRTRLAVPIEGGMVQVNNARQEPQETLGIGHVTE